MIPSTVADSFAKPVKVGLEAWSWEFEPESRQQQTDSTIRFRQILPYRLTVDVWSGLVWSGLVWCLRWPTSPVPWTLIGRVTLLVQSWLPPSPTHTHREPGHPQQQTNTSRVLPLL
ncbi:hypothetical protein UVI_02018470 [Ustilaginoidea virens]|uniref:Uncharacterized protein n=1 Tax=Ustilaginoidea virens TaxID=1159556 RepID=A0A1B5KTF0_USTVR|nr:hypothetical protein UVI_02018470 [Ustilaginoidea virens]